MSLFDTGIRPAVDDYLKKKSEETRNYGDYWSASSAGYCMRRVIFDRLKVPQVKEDARKQRVFEVGHIFHEWMQRITKDAGLSVAQELELQDEELMVRGHIDDLVLIEEMCTTCSGSGIGSSGEPSTSCIDCDGSGADQNLILYDYKTQNSRAFSYQKDKPISYYHKMQVGTYIYMLRKNKTLSQWNGDEGQFEDFIDARQVGIARILKISKDDLRMTERQLLWTPELEAEVMGYWRKLAEHWKSKTLPDCTCANHEGGFLAREAYNPYFYQDEPCSIEWAKQHVDLSKWK